MYGVRSQTHSRIAPLCGEGPDPDWGWIIKAASKGTDLPVKLQYYSKKIRNMMPYLLMII